MVLFIKNIIKFFIIFYGSFIGAIFINNYIIDKKGDFRLDKGINSIIIGNSQPECAYNDSLIKNFKNLAKPAEPYFYNYQKLKKIIEQNPQLINVFVEFNPTNIMVREDQKIWRDKFINLHLPNYNALLAYEDHKLLAIKNLTGYHQANLLSLRNNINRIILNRYNFIDSIGGYKYLRRNKVNADPNSIINNKQKQHLISNIQISTYNLLYLDKIIQLCEKSNINIYLVRSPYHQNFVGHSYESLFQQIRKERYSNTPFLDFQDFELLDDEFGDLQHLNYKGARKFSIWFNNWFQNQSIKNYKN